MNTDKYSRTTSNRLVTHCPLSDSALIAVGTQFFDGRSRDQEALCTLLGCRVTWLNAALLQ